MLSVIIPTQDSERALVRTLAPLVAGATTGLISEVLVADGGSKDDTAVVADVAGCNFMIVAGPLGRRLHTAAGAARAPWLMFLRPGTVLETLWPEEARRFVEQPSPTEIAAVFRLRPPARSAWREMLSLLATAFGRLPDPAQGLLISRAFYDALGGHSEHAAAPETDLISRIGRRRIAILATSAFYAP
jgi:glycosyltransferase involved in cell wall biosynthesis